MKNSILFTLALATFSMVFLLQSCKTEEEPVDECATASDSGEWGYDDFGGPACWHAVCSHDDGGCSGSKQSPINITGAVNTTSLPNLTYSLNSSATHIENNGHTIKFSQTPGSFITRGTLPSGQFDDYTLGQFHFHTNSEHQVDGSHAPLEAHLVFRSIWRDDYVVVSVMFEEGTENEFLAQFTSNLPAQEGGKYESADTYNVSGLLPANRSYYTYEGSLTTPPCSEVVRWIIMENRVQASAAQIQAFKNIMGDNFRPVQNLNNRVINRVVL